MAVAVGWLSAARTLYFTLILVIPAVKLSFFYALTFDHVCMFAPKIQNIINDRIDIFWRITQIMNRQLNDMINVFISRVTQCFQFFSGLLDNTPYIQPLILNVDTGVSISTRDIFETSVIKTFSMPLQTLLERVIFNCPPKQNNLTIQTPATKKVEYTNKNFSHCVLCASSSMGVWQRG